MDARPHTKISSAGKIGLGLLDFCSTNREISGPGGSVSITPKACAVLTSLVQAAPLAVSRSDLLDQVWHNADVSDAIVTDSVRIIRKAISKAGGDAGIVKTVPRMGYRVELPDSLPELAERTAPETRMNLPLVAVAGLSACLAVLVFLSSYSFSGMRKSSGHSLSAAEISASQEEQGAQVYYRRAREFYERYRAEDNETAIKLFNVGLREHPRDPHLTAGLAEAMAQSFEAYDGSADSARKAYDMAIANADSHPDVPVAQRAAGLAASIIGQRELAAQYYRRAIALDPNNMQALGNLGYVYVQLGQVSQAIPLFERSLAQDPTSARAHMFLGMGYRELGLFAEAESWFQRAQALALPTPSDHLEYLNYLMQQDRWSEGLDYAEVLLAKNESHLFQEGKARILALSGLTEEASRLYGTIVSQPDLPKNQESFLIARWLPVIRDERLRARLELALEASTRSLESWATENRGIPSVAHEMAVRYLALQDFDKGLEWLTRSAESGWLNSGQTMAEPAVRAALTKRAAMFSPVIDRMRAEQLRQSRLLSARRT